MDMDMVTMRMDTTTTLGKFCVYTGRWLLQKCTWMFSYRLANTDECKYVSRVIIRNCKKVQSEIMYFPVICNAGVSAAELTEAKDGPENKIL